MKLWVLASMWMFLWHEPLICTRCRPRARPLMAKTAPKDCTSSFLMFCLTCAYGSVMILPYLLVWGRVLLSESWAPRWAQCTPQWWAERLTKRSPLTDSCATCLRTHNAVLALSPYIRIFYLHMYNTTKLTNKREMTLGDAKYAVTLHCE